MNINGIILEGVCGTGKSLLLDHLLRANITSSTGKSLICLTEHHTQRVLEPLIKNNELTKDKHIEHLMNIVSFLDHLNINCQAQDWSERKRTAHIVTYILERFHLTHLIDYSYLAWTEMEKIDTAMSNLNGKLIILTANANTLSERLYENSRDPGWLQYLSGISENKNEVVNFFMKKQDLLVSVAEKSLLPKLILDSSDMDINDMVDNILNFWFQDAI